MKIRIYQNIGNSFSRNAISDDDLDIVSKFGVLIFGFLLYRTINFNVPLQ